MRRSVARVIISSSIFTLSIAGLRRPHTETTIHYDKDLLAKDQFRLFTEFLLTLNPASVQETRTATRHRARKDVQKRTHGSVTCKDLPIQPLLSDIVQKLISSDNLVLQAPPGAGKTTAVPLALLEEDELSFTMVLEPRRIAARSAAMRMASKLGEKVGDRVGYRIRGEGASGSRTKVLVVTEGVLLRRLQNDPELKGVDLVVFDEFHERSVTADVCLALCRWAQALRAQKLNEHKLRLLVMSATLGNTSELQTLLGGCESIISEGRSFPVEIKYLSEQPLAMVARLRSWEIGKIVADAIAEVLVETDGDLLAFLPGEGEINNAKGSLEQQLDRATLEGIEILPLFGALPFEKQREAIAPHRDGKRRVILATPIAESSLTIEGVRVVVDSGLRKVSIFDQDTGLSALKTIPISLASATQRSGRAGRVASGIAYRLWSKRDESKLVDQTPPEIAQADFAQPSLALASCGVVGSEMIANMPWLTQPPEEAVITAQTLLQSIGALSHTASDQGADQRILQPTPYASHLADLPLHPRLAHMILSVRGSVLEERASLLAALMSERDVLLGGSRENGIDIATRVDALQESQPPANANAKTWWLVKKQAKEMLEDLRHSGNNVKSSLDVELFSAWIAKTDCRDGILLSLAFPDRVGQLTSNEKYKLSNGKTVSLPKGKGKGEKLSQYIVAAVTIGSDKATQRIELSAPISLEHLRFALRSVIEEKDETFVAPSDGSIRSQRVSRLGSLVLSASPLPAPTSEETIPVLLEALRERGLEQTLLRANDKVGQEARELIARVALLRTLHGSAAEWPTWTEESLLADAEVWLDPALKNARGLKDLQKSDVAGMLRAMLDPGQLALLESQAPEIVTLPSGNKQQLKYAREDRLLPKDDSDGTSTALVPPVLASKLQEWFGSTSGPEVGGQPGKKVEVHLELLSPRHPPSTLAIVAGGLSAFWRDAYPGVRIDMKSRYPKHPWPEDPLTASPTRLTKKELERVSTEGISPSSSKANDGKKKGKKKRRKR